MANFVLRVNEGRAEVKNQFDEKQTVNASPTPPGRPGELFTPFVGAGSSSINSSYSSEYPQHDDRNEAIIELNKISGKTPSMPSPTSVSSTVRRRKDAGFESNGAVTEI